MARKSRNDRIAVIEKEMEELEKQKKKLIAEQKEIDRKARTNRLCKRHGLFESLLPDIIDLSEDDFKLFLEKTVANDFGRRTLAALIAEQSKPVTTMSTDKAAAVTEPVTPLSAKAVAIVTEPAIDKHTNNAQVSGGTVAQNAAKPAKQAG